MPFGVTRTFVVLAIVACAGAAAAPAQAKRYLTVPEAKELMFPHTRLDSVVVTASKTQLEEVERRARVRAKGWAPKCWRAPDGALFFVDQVLGKHEYITFAVAVDAKGAARAVEVLEYKETYGYEIRNEAWRAQFRGKTAADPVKLEKDVMNIGGATLSCRHITDGVRRLLVYRDVVLAPTEAKRP